MSCVDAIVFVYLFDILLVYDGAFMKSIKCLHLGVAISVDIP